MDNSKYQFPSIAKWIVSIIVVLLVIYALWYFRFLVVCISIAVVLSFMGRPLMKVLQRLSYKTFRIGNIGEIYEEDIFKMVSLIKALTIIMCQSFFMLLWREV